MWDSCIGVEIANGIDADELVEDGTLALAAQAAIRGPAGDHARMVLGDALLESGSFIAIGGNREQVSKHLDHAAWAWAKRAINVTMKQAEFVGPLRPRRA